MWILSRKGNGDAKNQEPVLFGVAIQLSYDFKQVNKLETTKSIDEVFKSMNNITKNLIKVAAKDAVDQAKINITENGNVVTGKLRGSIMITEEGVDYVKFGSELGYAGIVEFGRGPVVPVNKEYLRWFDPEKGKYVFRKYAGPTDPSPYMQPAVETTISRIDGLVAEAEHG